MPASLYGQDTIKGPEGETDVLGTRVINLNRYNVIKIPLNYTLVETQKLEFSGEDYVLRIYAIAFVQGNAAFLEIIPRSTARFRNGIEITAAFENKTIPLRRHVEGHGGIFAIPPDFRPGPGTVEIRIQDGDSEKTDRYTVEIGYVQFPVYRRSMHLGKYSDSDYIRKRPELQERIKRERIKKERIFSVINEPMLGVSLSHPRDYHRITSSFFAKRIYDRFVIREGKRVYQKPRISFHHGLDLHGRTGAPVYAMADGVVVIAEDMYYEGLHIVVDHGSGIFTRYMHQSEILVSTGDTVRAGDIIGKVGSTGMVTGPHLHIGLLIRGVYVDPMSLLSLPVR